MTHKEAVERLKELAGSRAWCLTHATASYYLGNVDINAYIAGVGHCDGAVTYSGAIKGMEILLEGNAPEGIPDEAPEASHE